MGRGVQEPQLWGSAWTAPPQGLSSHGLGVGLPPPSDPRGPGPPAPPPWGPHPTPPVFCGPQVLPRCRTPKSRNARSECCWPEGWGPGEGETLPTSHTSNSLSTFSAPPSSGSSPKVSGACAGLGGGGGAGTARDLLGGAVQRGGWAPHPDPTPPSPPSCRVS